MRLIKPDEGDLIPIPEFMQGISSTMFTDYDGFGYFATETETDDSIDVYPSNMGDIEVPTWATHILWFNK